MTGREAPRTDTGDGGGAEEALARPGFTEEAMPQMDAVYRFALRLTGGDEHEAQDLVQETYLRAHRSWSSYERGTNARAWLFTICRNLFLRRREREGRQPVPASQLDAQVEALAATDVFVDVREADPEQRFFDALIDREVLEAIDSLPPEFREAVTLSDVEGMSYEEIAEVMGVPLGTVKSRLFRGRRLLQQKLYHYALEMGYIRGPAR